MYIALTSYGYPYDVKARKGIMSHCSEVSLDDCLSSCMDMDNCVDERVMAYVDDMYGAYLLWKLSGN